MFHAVDLHTDSLVDARLSCSNQNFDGPVKIAKFHLIGASFQAFKELARPRRITSWSNHAPTLSGFTTKSRTWSRDATSCM